MQLDTANRRRLFFALLYFNEGAPIGLIWLALPTLLRSDEVSLERIGTLLSLVVIPWTLKFLAGPLVDKLGLIRGGSRSMLMATQAGMALTMLAASRYSTNDDLNWLVWVLVAHAVCAAMQDVTIDALAIRLSIASERGRLNAAMQLGLFTGRSAFAGLALGAITGFSWKHACIGLATIQVLTILVVALTNTASSVTKNRFAGGSSVNEAIFAALRRRNNWVALAFAGLAGAGYEATAALAGPWLLDRGVAKEAIGRWQAIGVPIMFVLGSQIGGIIADRRGHRATTAVGLIAFVVAIVGLATLEWFASASFSGMSTWIALGTMYCAVGVFTVGSYALFMDLTDPRIGGTQFSAFMAATNACEAWSLAGGGWLAAHYGYARGAILLCLVSLCSLVLLACLERAKMPEEAEETAAA